jgi:hypothetical protein
MHSNAAPGAIDDRPPGGSVRSISHQEVICLAHLVGISLASSYGVVSVACPVRTADKRG